MRGLKTLILRLTISTIQSRFTPLTILRTKYWKCCEPKRNQVTRRNIRMEMENMENFTYDGNYTDLEPLYSLKDNVSRQTVLQSIFLMLKIFKVLHAQSFIIHSIHCKMNFRLVSWSFSPYFTGQSLSRRFWGTPRSSSS